MFFLIFLLASPLLQVSSQMSDFPTITIKYSNVTEFIFTFPSSSMVHIPSGKDKGPVELICVAQYPITWDYVIEDSSISLADAVEYQRQVSNPANFRDHRENRFVAKVTLWELFESQTGLYVCRNFPSAANAHSKTIAQLFISGNRTFNTIKNSVKLANENTSTGIYCPVTNPNSKVTLLKLKNETWEDISDSLVKKHFPIFGFDFLDTTTHKDRLGKYSCRAESMPFENVSIEFTTDTKVVEAATNQITCRKNQELANYFRSAWLETLCVNSFAFFRNVNGTTSWRESSAKTFANLDSQAFPIGGRPTNVSVCEDRWSLNEDAMNFNKPKEICYKKKEETPSLNAFGKKFNSEPDNQTYTLLTVEYNGKWNEAGGNFILAITRNGSADGLNSTEEYLHNIEPHTRYFPMASQQAIWSNIRVNGTDIAKVIVYQPTKSSFGWLSIKSEVVLKEHVKSSGNLLSKPNFSILIILLFSYALSS